MSDAAAEVSPEPEVPSAHPWTQLPYEQWRLLRLAPLAVDSSTGPRPLRFAQLGLVERHSPNLSMLRLGVKLPDQAERKGCNTLEVWADHQRLEVRFGPDSGLVTDPINRGLGRFLLAQGIAWAKQRYAHYRVEGMALSAKDAVTEDSRGRRDHSLQAQGFEVSYLDPDRLKGRCNASSVATLHSDWQFDKVQELSLLDAAAMLKQADHNLREQEVKLRERDERIATLKREDGTLRFSIACLVTFCAFQAGLLIWIAAR